MGRAAARGKAVPARAAPERDIIIRRPNRPGRFRRKSSLGLLKWPNSPYRPALSENRVRRQASAPSGIGLLGRSQAVRQRILIPPFGGSIPPAPASNYPVDSGTSENWAFLIPNGSHTAIPNVCWRSVPQPYGISEAIGQLRGSTLSAKVGAR